VRIIAATNAHLPQAIAGKRFREDLYYRLSVLHLHLPPLRERTEDIAALCQFFLQDIAPDQNLVLPPEELAALCRYPWPGNVRELRNILERAILIRQDTTLRPSRLLAAPTMPANLQPAGSGPTLATGPVATLAEMEQDHIAMVLGVCHHNHSHAAQVLGIARSTLLRKLAEGRRKTGVAE
jgi:transcriptional regulator with PAS, ATPase and Fis domain